MPNLKKPSNTRWNAKQKKWQVYCDSLNSDNEVYFYVDPSIGIFEFSKQEEKIKNNPTFKKFMERKARDTQGIQKEMTETQAHEGGYCSQSLMGTATLLGATVVTTINFFKPSTSSDSSKLFSIYQTQCGEVVAQGNNTQLAQQCLQMAFDFLNKTATTEKKASTVSLRFSKAALVIGTVIALIIAALYYFNFLTINKEKKQKQYFELLKEQLKNLPNIREEIRLKENVMNKILALAGINKIKFQERSVRQSISALIYQEVPGDGHCLFHAVALHTGQDKDDLRDLVANHLEQNPEDFIEFISLPPGKTLGDYIAAVRTGTEWADHIEIEILMRVLNRPIIVIIPDGNIFNPDDLNRFNVASPIFVYYNNINHYDAFLLQDNYSTKDVLDQLKNFIDSSLENIKLLDLIFERLDAENDISVYERIAETLKSIDEIIVKKPDEDLCPIQFLLDLMKCESDIRVFMHLVDTDSIYNYLSKFKNSNGSQLNYQQEGVKTFINALLYKNRFLAQYELSNRLKLKIDISATEKLTGNKFYILNSLFSKKSHAANLLFSEDIFKEIHEKLKNFGDQMVLNLGEEDILESIEAYPMKVKPTI